MEDLERIKSRLDNIKALAPTLTALRNIAAGSLRLARTRLEAASVFTQELGSVLAALQSEKPRLPGEDKKNQSPKIGVLVIASERGLCGSFNATILTKAEKHIAAQQAAGYEVDVLTLGVKAQRYFTANQQPPARAESLPVTTVPSLALVQKLLQDLDEAYESGEYQRIDLVYTPYQVRAAPLPKAQQLVPSQIEPDTDTKAGWPRPIVDSDPIKLYRQVKKQWALVEFYRYVMQSAASEQSARYNVLDSASSNCDRLIEELTQSYHAARQHAINMEILDLVGGSGLLKGSREKN